MRPIDEIPGLELEQNARLQVWSWRFERTAWMLFATILGLAMAGLFGSGPLSRAELEAEGVRVEYRRFCLASAPMDLRFIVAAKYLKSGRIRLGLNSAFVRAFAIENISPQPEGASMEKQIHYFNFRAQNDAPEQEVIFHLRAGAVGKVPAVFRLDDGAEIKFSVLIYP